MIGSILNITPKHNIYVIKEDPDQTEKGKIISSIAAADSKFERNSTDCKRRKVLKNRKKLIKSL